MADFTSSYFVDDYIEVDYFDTVTLHDASANLTASASATADAFIPSTSGYFLEGYILEDYFVAGGEVFIGDAVLGSNFTAITDANRILGTDLIANSAFTNIVDAGAIRGVDADLNGAATFDMTALLSKPGDITLVVTSAMTTDAGKIHSDGPVLDSNFTTVAAAGKINTDGPILNSTFSSAVEAFRTRGIGPDLTATTTLVANNIRVQSATSDQLSSFEVIAASGQIESSNATLSSAFSSTVTAGKINTIEPLFNTNATAITDAALVASSGSALVAGFAVGNIAGIIGDYGVIIQPQFTMSATLGKVSPVSSAQVSTMSLPGVDSIRIIDDSANLNSEFTDSAKVNLIASSGPTLSTSATLASEMQRTRLAEAALANTMQFGLAVLGLKPGEINIAINSTLASNASVIAQTSLNLNSNFNVPDTQSYAIRATGLNAIVTATLATEGRLFVLNDNIVYVVPRETRTFSIKNEIRSANIEYESREYTVRSI